LSGPELGCALTIQPPKTSWTESSNAPPRLVKFSAQFNF